MAILCSIDCVCRFRPNIDQVDLFVAHLLKIAVRGAPWVRADLVLPPRSAAGAPLSNNLSSHQPCGRAEVYIV